MGALIGVTAAVELPAGASWQKTTFAFSARQDAVAQHLRAGRDQAKLARVAVVHFRQSIPASNVLKPGARKSRDMFRTFHTNLDRQQRVDIGLIGPIASTCPPDLSQSILVAPCDDRLATTGTQDQNLVR